MRLVYCVVIFACLVGTQAQDDKDAFPDYWQNEYDNFYDYPVEGNDADSLEKAEDTDKQVQAEIQDFREQNEAEVKPDETFDGFVDYQIEDNRSDEKKEAAQENLEKSPEVLPEIPDVLIEPMPDDAPEIIQPELQVIPIEEKKSSEDDAQKNDQDLDDFWKDFADIVQSSVEEVQPKADDKDDVQPEKTPEPEPETDDKPDVALEQADLNNIFEETKKLLDETEEKLMDEYDSFSYEDDEKTFDDLFPENKDEEDTPEKVLKDLSSDLDKLLETLDKLSNDNPESSEDTKMDGGVDEIKDYEEKYDRPYKEGNILNLREDYDNFDDSNLPDIFAENASDESKEKVEEPINDEDINETTTKTADELVSSTITADEADVSAYLDELNKRLDLDDSEENNQRIDELVSKIWSLSYGEDGLVDETQPKNEDAELLTTTDTVQTSSTIQEENISTTQVDETTTAINDQSTSTQVPTTVESSEIKTVPDQPRTEDLTSAEYNDLMTKFASGHSEDLDVNSEKFAKNVAPVHIILSVDEPTVVTSPNFPGNYPTNNVVDWIIDGPGTGIELNVTELDMNGAAGDYLLVKPGAEDASGSDGIIFSWRLTRERKYRFTNVNRMFVRFQTHAGWPIFKGFSFSAKMIFPLPELNTDMDDPEAEAVIAAPKDTATVYLSGLTLPQFQRVQPAFKEMIANMAHEYIVNNDIDEGLNVTSEVTQITRVAVCNIRWPQYETCVEVTFGVPLQYEGEAPARLNTTDLNTMWQTYIVMEEYADQLRDMGVTEYAVPDDDSIFLVWLVIGAGVVIAMAMLAFALWRFSCFEDYTRMRASIDGDSIQNEKKHLDLYPTPHQTLPPLYADVDYKWADENYDDAARVDMGGFANKSYVRDDLFEFDSEEDITPRDRTGINRTKDGYEV